MSAFGGAASGGAAAGAAARAAAEAAAQAAISAASLVSFDLTSLEKVFQIKKRYEIAQDGELMVWDDFVEVEEDVQGWFGKTKKEKKIRSRYLSLPEAIAKHCPEGCAFLAFTLDWYNSMIRIFYGKPPCPQNNMESSEQN